MSKDYDMMFGWSVDRAIELNRHGLKAEDVLRDAELLAKHAEKYIITPVVEVDQ